MAVANELVEKPVGIYERFPELSEIPREHFPRHILIIPDGNRRHARARNEDVLMGHVRGMQKVIDIMRDLEELPIGVVTFWAFSADNWDGRPQEERSGLMAILKAGISAHIDELDQKGVRFVQIGRKDRIRQHYPELLQTVSDAEEQTAGNTKSIVCLAIDYGGTDEQIRAAKAVAMDAAKGLLEVDEIDEAYLASKMDGHGLIPAADVIIRTSVHRTSDVGRLNGKSTYVHFVDKLFPDITTEDMVKGILGYAAEEQRHGK